MAEFHRNILSDQGLGQQGICRDKQTFSC